MLMLGNEQYLSRVAVGEELERFLEDDETELRPAIQNRIWVANLTVSGRSGDPEISNVESQLSI